MTNKTSDLGVRTLAGCRRQWTPTAKNGEPGCDSHYLQWIAWEQMADEHGITAEEADTAWAAFRARHGAAYPGGDWAVVERAHLAQVERQETAERHAIDMWVDGVCDQRRNHYNDDAAGMAEAQERSDRI